MTNEQALLLAHLDIVRCGNQLYRVDRVERAHDGMLLVTLFGKEGNRTVRVELVTLIYRHGAIPPGVFLHLGYPTPQAQEHIQQALQAQQKQQVA